MMQPMPSDSRRTWVSASLAVLLTGSAVAHAAEPQVGVRSLAMGDSLRAMATQSEGMLLNPSGLALTKQFQATGFYSLRLPSFGHFLHASLSDSITNRHFALGLYYNYLTEKPRFAFRLRSGGEAFTQLVQGAEIVRTGHESGTALAIPIGERFTLGASLKYGYYTLRAQLGQDMAPPGQTAADSRIDRENSVDLGSVDHVVTFDIGATVRPFAGLHIGIVGQNLWPHGVEMPTLLGIGLGYQLGERLLLAADTVINFTGQQTCIDMSGTTCTETARKTTVRFGLGGEYAIAGRVPLRLGYLYDNDLRAHHTTFGLGFISRDPGFAIDVSVRQRVSGGSETVLLIGLRILRGDGPSEASQ